MDNDDLLADFGLDDDDGVMVDTGELGGVVGGNRAASDAAAMNGAGFTSSSDGFTSGGFGIDSASFDSDSFAGDIKGAGDSETFASRSSTGEDESYLESSHVVDPREVKFADVYLKNSVSVMDGIDSDDDEVVIGVAHEGSLAYIAHGTAGSLIPVARFMGAAMGSRLLVMPMDTQSDILELKKDSRAFEHVYLHYVKNT